MITESEARGVTFYLVFGSWGGVGFRRNASEIRLVLGWVGFAILFFDIERLLTESQKLSGFRILAEMRERDATTCRQEFESVGEKVTILTTREPLEEI